MKAPNGILCGGGGGGATWASPVAEGYVFNDGVRRVVEGGPRL